MKIYLIAARGAIIEGSKYTKKTCPKSSCLTRRSVDMTKPMLAARPCAGVRRASGDETRLKIMELLLAQDKCVSELVAEIGKQQPHVSHHLRILREAGLVEGTREGQRVCYRVLPSIHRQLRDSKQQVLDLVVASSASRTRSSSLTTPNENDPYYQEGVMIAGPIALSVRTQPSTPLGAASRDPPGQRRRCHHRRTFVGPTYVVIYMNCYCDLSGEKVIGAVLMVVLLGVPVLAEGQAPAADQLTGKLVITGASTLAPLIAENGRRFESLYPAVRIDVQSEGSSRGVADARQNLADTA